MAKKKFQWQKYIGVLFFLLIGAFSGYFIGYYIGEMVGEGKSMGAVLGAFAVLFLGMYAVIYLQILIHEAGHLVFGLLTGYRFSIFRIFSVTFLREQESGKIRVRRMSLAGTGGQCLMIPPEPIDGKIPYVLYHLGGVLMNLISVVLFGILYVLFRTNAMLAILFLIGVIVGVAYAFMNGVPLRLGMVDNDGYNLLSQTKSREAMEAGRLQLLIGEATARGMRLRDMPAEWFVFPSDEAIKNSMVAVIGVITCSRLMDEGKYEEAEWQITRLCGMESGMVGLHRNLLVCDKITCLLLDGTRRDEAEALLTKEQQQFMKAMRQNPSVIRCKYAIAKLLVHDDDDSGAQMALFEKIAKTYPFPADIEGEREIIACIDEAASAVIS